MKDQHEDDRQFNLRLDKNNEELDESVVPGEINELKLEKISQRVTLISVLIPVLIVIILVFTYMDIKRRVIQTEDFGEMEMQKISKDLESRFSSLSLRQAKLEETLDKLIEQNNRSSAAIQVRLEKLNDSIKEIRQSAVGAKEFNATRADMVKQINSVIESTNQAGDQVAAISSELKKQIDQLNQGVASADRQLNALDRRLTETDQNKIDKSALELALRLETLKIETAMKSQLKELHAKIGTLEEQLARRPVQTVPAPQSSPAPTPAVKTESKPEAVTKPPAPANTDKTAGTGIEEQTIDQ
jgi:DNA repair exonuclease SbcCD ATPase subunit